MGFFFLTTLLAVFFPQSSISIPNCSLPTKNSSSPILRFLRIALSCGSGIRKDVFVVAAALLAVFGAGGFDRAESSSDEAYMTLLYGDEFLLGVRVLGRSIRDTGATKDMVALVSDGVSDYAKKLLEVDGWIVKHISLVANPNSRWPKRFWGVYTKLKIFSMTSYRKVVYLDADTIVLKSIEDLFKCGKFCANLKHSERLNSGVMVVEPSETLYNDMMRKVTSLYSYTGGDQGFLNSYYADFPNAHIFEPNVTHSKVPEMQRLSTIYNADVGLYMLANKWMVNETELRVIHYTLGPLKPWDWWTAWLLKPVDVWQNVRENLRETLPGTGGGRNPHDQLVVKILFALPICVLLFYCYRSCIQMNMNRDMFRIFTRSSINEYLRRIYFRYRSGGRLPSYSAIGVASSSIANSNQQLPAYLGAISVFICFMAAIVSLALAFVLVPRQTMPWTGLLLMYEWTFATFFISFNCYLHLIYRRGKITAHRLGNNHSRADSSTYDSGKGHLRNPSSYDMITWFYWSGMAFLAVAAPLLPGLLGITALFSRLGLMVAGGIILASFMAFASEHLAIRIFIKGCEDREPRTRNLCFMF